MCFALLTGLPSCPTGGSRMEPTCQQDLLAPVLQESCAPGGAGARAASHSTSLPQAEMRYGDVLCTEAPNISFCPQNV